MSPEVARLAYRAIIDINQASGCSDYCCRECEKFNECSFKCEGNPEKCGQAYIKLR
ncbi:hypothetical protein [Caloramator proteoclasticus]|uniref:Uncharacterized protein n=1 Tax=Caloramator proteoclasticus DSM 10124 TaxID=1121262 RepID=A0A1M4ZFD9_9CLOT|nr:hypothetical protein [Caloramator proteoclasticus]SHF16721.1 hypothetical protein SAMN02746091_01908 [Caloramator proteoclasticus DSM 10124]